jgi:hypothetical protein
MVRPLLVYGASEAGHVLVGLDHWIQLVVRSFISDLHHSDLPDPAAPLNLSFLCHLALGYAVVTLWQAN